MCMSLYLQILFSLPLGFLRIHINALSMTTLLWTPVPSFMTTAKTIVGTFSNQQSLSIPPSLLHAVNVLSKINLILGSLTNFNLNIYIDINAPTFTRPRYFSGRLQCLTTAASPAPIQPTKLIQSLRQLILMISARVLRHKFAENYQVY